MDSIYRLFTSLCAVALVLRGLRAPQPPPDQPLHWPEGEPSASPARLRHKNNITTDLRLEKEYELFQLVMHRNYFFTKTKIKVFYLAENQNRK